MDQSPFAASTYNRWQPTDATGALLRDGANAAVVFTDSSALQGRPQLVGCAHRPPVHRAGRRAVLVLQYGGFGDLWGIPGSCVSRLTNEHVSCDTQDSRYVPAFVIPFGEVLGRVSDGGTTYVAKWLDREIPFARKDVSVCSTAGVSLPSALSLPSASGLQNPSDPASAVYIGEKPVVTAARRIIDGDVKY